MQEAVQFLPQLSRTELARTVCEQRGWHTPGESTRWRFSRGVLGELERLGIVQLPASQGRGPGPQKPLHCDRRSAPQLSVREPLAELAPVGLETYVNPRQHPAACYPAANWQLVGRTQARVGAAGPLLPAPLLPPQQEMEASQARRSPDRRLNRTLFCRQSSAVLN